MFLPRRPICLPSEDCVRPTAYLALGAMILLEHLHVWVVGEAVLAYARHVGGLPSRAVEIVFDLLRHGRGVVV
jgi:hypothetical protein